MNTVCGVSGYESDFHEFTVQVRCSKERVREFMSRLGIAGEEIAQSLSEEYGEFAEFLFVTNFNEESMRKAL